VSSSSVEIVCSLGDECVMFSVGAETVVSVGA
jgi:hypothetical protein